MYSLFCTLNYSQIDSTESLQLPSYKAQPMSVKQLRTIERCKPHSNSPLCVRVCVCCSRSFKILWKCIQLLITLFYVYRVIAKEKKEPPPPLPLHCFGLAWVCWFARPRCTGTAPGSVISVKRCETDEFDEAHGYATSAPHFAPHFGLQIDLD
jgi:hypothetical protein